ncbi:MULTISPECIES: hypothetical protein [Lysinibacillus]|uniref:hypothetical protein n=1 Tax=Lysinibacillus TaxID=400634 RepID=UPI00214A93EF|nr:MULTISPECIES: hypothetical protein [Lysinibacillus]UUV26076.1 hypothetical protein NP781_05525 [Lysinibacillus sp. FN11]UYB48949.1 hypothetical protein OCI51_08305 [Lysinibacillus capsici]
MQEQLTLFDDLVHRNNIFQVHDKVKLQLVEETFNFEIYNYRKHYFEQLIGKMGTVIEVRGNTIMVQISGEIIPCEACELEWIA